MNNQNQKLHKDSLLTRLLLAVNSLALILLVCSYLSMYVNPNSIWILAFCGIAYPYILLGNILFVLLWIIIRPKYALYSAFFIVAGYNHFFALYQFSGKSKPNDSISTFKVMSYNVRLFDLYNYNKDWSFNFEGRNEILKFIRQENPDIACFQEYFYDSSNKFCTTDSLTSILKTQNIFTYFPQVIKGTDHYGIAIFSRYPIIDSGTVIFEQKTNNTVIFINIRKGDKTYRIYNAHLQSIRFGKEDYVFADESPKNKAKQNSLNKASQKIISKLKQAYLLRAGQAKQLAEHISKSPYPVILCGDFNDTPTSFAYHTLSKKLTDSFIESGKGFGKSYSGKMPSFRIDYIFHDKHFEGYDFTTHQEINASDHYPVTVLMHEKK